MTMQQQRRLRAVLLTYWCFCQPSAISVCGLSTSCSSRSRSSSSSHRKSSNISTGTSTRRRWLQNAAAMTAGGIGSVPVFLPAFPAAATTAVTTATTTNTAKEPAIAFTSSAVGQEEYTNAITASRDTNISPKEAYDTIRAKIPVAVGATNNKKALDLGAGAGLSTHLLYEAGYRTIDAVDWSAEAWNSHVQTCPSSVTFYEMADAQFLRMLQQKQQQQQTSIPTKYDVIVYNFAVNPEKAIQTAKDFLLPTPGSILLAPVNDKPDYWYKQTYWLVDATGAVLERSAQEVGAWSVQFQPDVTAPTCTGIWCGGFNGFQQQQR